MSDDKRNIYIKYAYKATLDFLESSDISINPKTKDRLKNLFECTKLVDHYVDNSIVTFREIGDFFQDKSVRLPSDLSSKLRILSNNIQSLKVADEFTTLLDEAANIQKRMRIETGIRKYANLSMKEGIVLAEFAILLLGKNTNKKFENFYKYGSALFNLFDDMLDVSDDYQNDEIAIKPSLKFRLYCFLYLLVRTPKLFHLRPNFHIPYKYGKEIIKIMLQTAKNSLFAVNKNNQK